MYIPRFATGGTARRVKGYRVSRSLVGGASWFVGVLASSCSQPEAPELARVGALEFGQGNDSRLSLACATCATEACEREERNCFAEPSCAAELECRRACGAWVGDNECAAECQSPRDSAGKQTSETLQTCYRATACTACREFVRDIDTADGSADGETGQGVTSSDAAPDPQTAGFVDAAVSGCTIPEEVTSECSLCAWNACCEQFAACNVPGPCSDAKNCFFDCYDACVADCVGGDCNGTCTSSCQEQCMAEDYAGYAAFNARNICGLTTECLAPCGGEADACLTCQEQCRDLQNTCLRQPGCQEVTLCVQHCGSDAGCVDRCFLDYESELAPFADWLDCVSGLCGAECSP